MTGAPPRAFADGDLMKDRAVFTDFCVMGHNDPVEPMGQPGNTGKFRAESPMGTHGGIVESIRTLDIVQPPQIPQPGAPVGVHHDLAVTPILLMVVFLHFTAHQPLGGGQLHIAHLFHLDLQSRQRICHDLLFIKNRFHVPSAGNAHGFPGLPRQRQEGLHGLIEALRVLWFT